MKKLLLLLALLPFAIQAQKISQLPVAAALSGLETIPITQNGTTVGASATQFANFIGASQNDLNILGNWNFAAATGTPLNVIASGATPLSISGAVGTAPATVDAGQLFSITNSSTAGGDKRILAFGQVGANAFIRPILEGSPQTAAGFSIITGPTVTNWTPAGNMTVSAPSSGVALTVVGNALNGVINSVNNGGGAAFGAVLNVAGSGFSMTTPVNTNSNVFTLAQSGQSTWTLNNLATTNAMVLSDGFGGTTWSSAGNVSVSAPTAGTALTVTAASGANGAIFNQNGTGGTSATFNSTGAVTTVGGGNIAFDTNGNMFFQSAAANTNLSIGSFATNTAITLLTSAASRLTINQSGNVAINAPSSGSSLTVNSLTGNGVQINGPVAGGDIAFQITLPNIDSLWLGSNSSGITNAVGALSGTDYLFTNQARSLSFGTAGQPRLAISATGNVTVNTPTGCCNALTVNSASGQLGIGLIAPNITSNSFGILINAGTNASDWPLTLQNAATTSHLFQVRGDGSTFFPLISTTASAANAFLDGANGNNLLRSTSSRRYKTDIAPISNAVASRVLSLTPISYHSKAAADDPSLLWYGLIAEDVAAIEPRLVAYDPQGLPDGVQYDRVGVLLLSVVKHQQDQIHLLELAFLALAGCCVYNAFRRRTLK